LPLFCKENIISLQKQFTEDYNMITDCTRIIRDAITLRPFKFSY